MTIYTIYHVFGFLLPVDECLDAIGYTINNLPQDIKDEYEGEDLTMFDFFTLEHYDGFTFKVKANGISGKFIIRNFTHDSEYHGVYFAVGVDIGSVENFEGKYHINELDGKPFNLLKVLSFDEKWRNVLRKAIKNRFAFGEKNGTYAGKDSKGNDCYICPQILTTTNDCECCS